MQINVRITYGKQFNVYGVDIENRTKKQKQRIFDKSNICHNTHVFRIRKATVLKLGEDQLLVDDNLEGGCEK